MIQPINALTPRADFRGSNGTYKGRPMRLPDSNVALINAGGVSLSAGGLTTITARAYTKSWAPALTLGLLGASLTMFFMAPHLIARLGLDKVGKNKA